jgi:hypothetical protein
VDRPRGLVRNRGVVVVDDHDDLPHAVEASGAQQRLDHVVDVVGVVREVDPGVHSAPRPGADHHHRSLGDEAEGQRHEGGDVVRCAGCQDQ